MRSKYSWSVRRIVPASPMGSRCGDLREHLDGRAEQVDAVDALVAQQLHLSAELLVDQRVEEQAVSPAVRRYALAQVLRVGDLGQPLDPKRAGLELRERRPGRPSRRSRRASRRPRGWRWASRPRSGRQSAEVGEALEQVDEAREEAEPVRPQRSSSSMTSTFSKKSSIGARSPAYVSSRRPVRTLGKQQVDRAARLRVSASSSASSWAPMSARSVEGAASPTRFAARLKATDRSSNASGACSRATVSASQRAKRVGGVVRRGRQSTAAIVS